MTLTIRQVASAVVDQAGDEIDGKALSRPQLRFSDGVNLTYVIDVDIGEKTPLKAVPIARGNRALSYADAGAALRLRRTGAGQFTVVGFSKQQPGTYTELLVDIDTLAIGAPIDRTIAGRPLTYGELATLGGGYGIAPYGATGVFIGGVLQDAPAPTPAPAPSPSPSPSGTPAIYVVGGGAFAVGAELAVDTGTLSGVSAYQWIRADGSTSTDVGSAATYPTTSADGERVISCVITHTGGTTAALGVYIDP